MKRLPQVKKCLGGASLDYAQSVQQTSDGGYIVAGVTASSDINGMTYHNEDDPEAEGSYIIKLDVKGNVVWQGKYCGSARSIQQTNDGGYIVAAYKYLIKLDGDGNVEWQKQYGRAFHDFILFARQTSDGGYIVGGASDANDPDISDNNYNNDLYILKLDGDGNIMWQKMYGGSENESLKFIQQTDDGNYIVAGSSFSTDINGAANHGSFDYYIIKLDSNGNVMWQKMYGGSDDDRLESFQQISDGGYIAAGSAKSTDISGLTNHGSNDWYIIKLDSDGDVEWQKMLGGSGEDRAMSVRQTGDGRYLVAGASESNDVSGVSHIGRSDYYIVKLNTTGNVVWQKMYGGSISTYSCDIYSGCTQSGAYDVATSIHPTNDGGCIVAGYSDSTDISGVTNHGNYDVYLIKLNSNGALQSL